MQKIYSILRKTSIPLLITAILTIFTGFLITKNFLSDLIDYNFSLFETAYKGCSETSFYSI